MQNKSMKKFAGLILAGGLLLGSGCSLSSLGQNAWTGFGQSLGAVPANILAGYITNNFLGFLTPDDGEDAE